VVTKIPDMAGAARAFIFLLEARDWDAFAALLHPEVVYELPQTRERIRGRDAYLRFNQEFPGDWHLDPTTVVADADHGVVRFDCRVEDESAEAIAFLDFDAEGCITRVTDFWPESYAPPAGREQLVERW